MSEPYTLSYLIFPTAYASILQSVKSLYAQETRLGLKCDNPILVIKYYCIATKNDCSFMPFCISSSDWYFCRRSRTQRGKEHYVIFPTTGNFLPVPHLLSVCEVHTIAMWLAEQPTNQSIFVFNLPWKGKSGCSTHIKASKDLTSLLLSIPDH